MREKITLEHFREIVSKINAENERIFADSDNVDDTQALKLIEEYGNTIYPLLQELTSYDLSDIPSTEYDFVIFVPKDKSISFNGTNATINLLDLGCYLEIANINFENCNIINYQYLNTLEGERVTFEISRQVFGEETIRNHPDVFLDDSFDIEFRQKYLNGQCVIEDLIGFSPEQIAKFSRNHRYVRDFELHRFINSYGVEPAIKAYKEDPNFYLVIINNISFLNQELIDRFDVKEIMNHINQELRESFAFELLGKSDATKSTFKTIFIENYTTDQGLIDRYYKGTLTYDDLVNNQEIFTVLEYDFSVDYKIPNNFAKMYEEIGYQKVIELNNKYPQLMHALFSNENAPKVLDYSTDFNPNRIEDTLRAEVRKYLTEGMAGSKIPEGFSEMFTKIVFDIPDPSELEDYEHIIIKDFDSQDVIDRVGAGNLYRFSQESNMYELYKEIYESGFIERLIDNYNRIPFHKPPRYEDFVRWMIETYLNDSNRLSEVPDFSKISPDLIVPKEFSKIQYITNCATIQYLTTEQREYLCTHDIRYRFSKNIWFVGEYCERFGNENFLNFLNQNMLFFETILYEDDFDFTKSEEEVQNQFYKAIYDDYIGHDDYKNADWIVLNEEMIKRYPQFDFSDISDNYIRRILMEGKLGARIIKENPELVEILRQKDYRAMTRKIHSTLSEEEFYKLAPIYGKFLDSRAHNHSYEAMEQNAYQMVLNGEEYDETYREVFKSHSEMFCSDSVSPQLKDAFYGKYIVYTEENIKYFSETNIAFGNHDMLFMADLQLEGKTREEDNRRKYLIMEQYKKIREDDENSQQEFRDFIRENYHELTEERIAILGELFNRISYANSSELVRIRTELERQLLYVDDPLEKFDTIEKIFASNHIPGFGKRFLVYKTINPDMPIFDRMSPVLKKYEDHPEIKDAIIFADLIRINLESANTDFVDYLDNIEAGEKLYREIITGELYGPLSLDQVHLLKQFSECLKAIYNYSRMPNKDEFVEVDDPIENIKNLSKFLKVDNSSSIADRIVKMYCYFAGIESVEDARRIIDSALDSITERNKDKTDFSLKAGDLIKGIGDIKFLGRILDNGSVAQEFLGCDANTDYTPLDTDCIKIAKGGSFVESVSATPAATHGPIYFVLKSDKFFESRDMENKNKELPKRIRDNMRNYELFRTGTEEHFGIRTGFPIGYIDHIVTEIPNKQIGYELARKGVYIPVVDTDNNLIFTYDDYLELRSKMQGLSHLGCPEYKLSDNLETPEIVEIAKSLDDNASNVAAIQQIIFAVIEEVCKEQGIRELRPYLSKDITFGFSELIDTGSTGRGTNKPNDSDFDYMMRLDTNIFKNTVLIEKLKVAIKEKILENGGTVEITNKGDFRFSGVNPGEIADTIDIDISFTPKTDGIEYTTDLCLKDRLESIRDQYGEEKYKLVVANIILAKKVLKEAHCYKGHFSNPSEGGLGGVGVENWILQNGGSFYDACLSFLEAANRSKDFEEFKENYQIWDFGENFEGKIGKNHDEFVSHKMDSSGYEKMKEVITNYLRNVKSNEEIASMINEEEPVLDSTDKFVL
ncbi:MAG: hypothetical protein IJI58_02155 [Bacilli bacterium]|nr:hypothetical protein [Bacilli bacterium]